ncbi:hypothetical protein TREES_T100005475 [Tupaia chinensis]|uniref:Uncharacterized protein n=1 Tax=Tupaia chinensis TaxID=246437 RepID=L9KH60_TUPCH|nr:hypothetical protein TREES_T100005475 [Tupaia chinensis]
MATRVLCKVFLSIKGMHYQVEVRGHPPCGSHPTPSPMTMDRHGLPGHGHCHRAPHHPAGLRPLPPLPVVEPALPSKLEGQPQAEVPARGPSCWIPRALEKAAALAASLARGGAAMEQKVEEADFLAMRRWRCRRRVTYNVADSCFTPGGPLARAADPVIGGCFVQPSSSCPLQSTSPGSSCLPPLALRAGEGRYVPAEKLELLALQEERTQEILKKHLTRDQDWERRKIRQASTLEEKRRAQEEAVRADKAQKARLVRVLVTPLRAKGSFEPPDLTKAGPRT